MSLNGLSLQYFNATDHPDTITPLNNVTLEPGQHHLIVVVPAASSPNSVEIAGVYAAGGDAPGRATPTTSSNC